MNNIQVTYRLLALPEKHLYKSETNRHDKLRTYLQNIIEIKEIYKNY